MSEDSKTGGAVSVARAQVPTQIPMGPKTTMDLAWLPEEERKALMVGYAKGMLDISQKAQELHVDVATLENTLRTLTGTTKEIAESGNSVTVTHTQTTKIGRTEIVMGNTSEAEKGRLSRSQTGQTNWIPLYVIGGLIAVVMVAAAIGGG